MHCGGSGGRLRDAVVQHHTEAAESEAHVIVSPRDARVFFVCQTGLRDLQIFLIHSETLNQHPNSTAIGSNGGESGSSVQMPRTI